MANLTGHQEITTPGNRVAVLYGRATLDGSGQVVTSQDCKRFSIARTSAGVYTITLTDKWLQLVGCNVMVLAAGVTPAGDGGNWKVNSAAVSAATPTIVIMNETFASPGVAVDPQPSAILLITLALDRGRI
jgi:hypothetical protein